MTHVRTIRFGIPSNGKLTCDIQLKYIPLQVKKEELCLSPMTKALIPIE